MNWKQPLMRCRQYNSSEGPEMECCNEITTGPGTSPEIVCICTEKNCNSQGLVERYKQAIESGKSILCVVNDEQVQEVIIILIGKLVRQAFYNGHTHAFLNWPSSALILPNKVDFLISVSY